jgi:hypothetical protein
LLCFSAGSAGADAGDEVDEDDLETAALIVERDAATPALQQAGYTVKAGHFGPGCPTNSVWSATVAPAGQDLVVTLTNASTFTPLTAKTTDASAVRSATCFLKVQIDGPVGVAYALSRIAFQGYAKLDAGVAASFDVSPSFTGIGSVPKSPRRVVGPLTGPVQVDDDFERRGALAWSACEANNLLDLDVSAALENTTPRQTGAVSMSDASGRTRLTLRLKTRRC